MKKNLVLGAVCYLLGLSFAFAEVQEGVVYANNLIIRARPAGYFERIGQLNKGEKVRIINQKMDWLEIYLPEGRTLGWVSRSHIDEAGVVVSEFCDLHSGPGKVFTSFYRARKGEPLKLVKQAGQDRWCQVKAPAKATGWVAGNFIRIGSEPELTPVPAQDPVSQPAAVKAPAAAPELKELEQKKSAVSTDFIARRAAIKEQHAQELNNLSRETERLKQLQAQADQLKQETADRKQQLQTLKIESERMQALKTAAEAKVALAKSESEKASLVFQQEQQRLLKMKGEAEYKAKTVLAEREKWEAEAARTALALKKAREKARLDAQMAENEARTLKNAEQKAVIQAEEALKKTMEAEKQQEASEAELKKIAKAVKELQQEVDVAGKKVEILRLEREKMTASAKEENAKLLMMKAEAERIALEQKSLALKIEQYKKESEILSAEAEKQALIVSRTKKDMEVKKAEAVALKEKQEQEKAAAAEKEKQVQEKAAAAEKAPVSEKAAAAEKAPVSEKAAATASSEDSPEQKKIADNSRKPSAAAEKAPAENKAAAVKPAGDKDRKAEKSAAADSKAGRKAPAVVVSQKKAAEKTAAPREKIWEGVVISLGSRASVFATHVLCIRRQYSLSPVCYLRSSQINLQDWVQSDVRLMGEEHTLPNWTRPIIEVKGIMKKNAAK